MATGARVDTWQVLTLDGDTDSRRCVTSYLGARGFGVAAAFVVEDLWRRLQRRGADVVVIDLQACGDDPLAVLRELRRRTMAAVVVVVEQAADPIDRILALEMGADDVLARPLVPRELLARLRAFQRRVAAARRYEAASYRFAGWRFLPAQRRLIAPDEAVQRLTRGECALLRALAAAPHRLLSRERLLQAVHPRSESAAERSIDVVVARLRRKLGAARAVITAERGVGYRFDCDVSPEDLATPIHGIG